jgi:hypothetical protein
LLSVYFMSGTRQGVYHVSKSTPQKLDFARLYEREILCITLSNEEMIKIKIVHLEKLYNFVVGNFLI